MKFFMVALVLAPTFFSCQVLSGRTPAPQSSATKAPAQGGGSSAAQLYKFSANDASNKSSTASIVRFRKEIGLPFVVDAMKEAADDVFKVFQQQNVADRKHAAGTQVHSEIHDVLDGAVGYYFQKEKNYQVILLSAAFLDNMDSKDVKDRFKGLVHHEMTHVWQWYGNEAATNPPAWLFEGIADYVPLTSGFQIYEWAQPGAGKKWDESTEVTAAFLTYCDSLKPGFIPTLNKMMKTNYSDDYFVQLTGKSIQQLWTDYKAKYGQKA
ncbi:hypothetical protein Leryth_015335 [Lithospermum erythrorhizon]|nr:hypothetical protein Leryth_015335 [Lithospermum erythrorhizon]